MKKEITITNLNRPDVRGIKALYCDRFWCRLKGYMFRNSIREDEGLVLVQAKASRVDAAVHMLAVFTNLAVFWLDSNLVVVDRCLARSWRPFYMPEKPARMVFECSPTRYEDFQIGDTLNFETSAAH
jgi:uncharacterized membrane protein (UPF0127 family)